MFYRHGVILIDVKKALQIETLFYYLLKFFKLRLGIINQNIF
ncbi:hypothetical protein ADIWIN_1052 [Winogradskyella psychrotolerans RS-3]|uniref:Uncharacterized protein n=1 Tax=Winogradskyella psychrotolerans RS-3 TaxID=641526 RepID=S7VWV7_9FLAO|nr:hypothetical protein ADIWIN_1052 [Winogradskyella psychrotolerans RS-3]